jgi:dolichol-phosphate mannosyltransferase
MIENGGERVGLAAGQRVGRKDTGFKKIQSRVANGVRNAILLMAPATPAAA